MSDKIIKKFQFKPLPTKDGEFDEHVQKLSMSRRLVMDRQDQKSSEFMSTMGSLDGVEGVDVRGPYSVIVVIGDCFDVEAVLASIKEIVEAFHSDIVVPDKTLKLV